MMAGSLGGRGYGDGQRGWEGEGSAFWLLGLRVLAWCS